MQTELELPNGRKRDRETKSSRSYDDDTVYRPSKTYRTGGQESAALSFEYSERDQQDAELARELNVGHRAQIAEPTDDPIGAGFAKGGDLAAALSVGAGVGRPFGAAPRVLPASRGPLPPGGLGRAGGGADVEPIIGLFPQDRHARVIRSTGRDAPAAPQSNIVVTVIVAKNIYEARSKVPDDDAIAPLGTEEDFRIMQGEWCFMVAENRKANRMTMLQDTDIEVISCVNGKSRYERLQFVGNMQGKGSNPADPRSDDHATVQIAGVMSGINTGLDTIPPFVPVHFREDPAAVIDASGRPVPAIAENGQPTTKFRPTSYPYTEEIISASVARLEVMISAVWEQTRLAVPSGAPVNMSLAVPPTDGDGARQDTFWRTVSGRIDDHFRSSAWGNEDHPLKVYARWYAINLMLQFVNTTVLLANPAADDATEAALIHSRFFVVIRAAKQARAAQERNKNIRNYNSVLGQTMTLRLNPLLSLVWPTGMTEDRLMVLPAGAAAWTGGARLLAASRDLYPQVKQALSHYIQAQMVQGVQEQHNKNRLSFAGISLKLSQPGKPLDLLRGTNL